MPLYLLINTVVLAACSPKDQRDANSSQSAAAQPTACPTLAEHVDAFAQQQLNVLPDANVSGLYLYGPERVLAISLKSDLRHLLIQQEVYYADHGTYGTDVRAIGLRALPGIDVRVLAADTVGWNATAASCLARTWCAISVGRGPATQLRILHQKPDEPACET
jgi:hypothetical protein